VTCRASTRGGRGVGAVVRAASTEAVRVVVIRSLVVRELVHADVDGVDAPCRGEGDDRKGVTVLQTRTVSLHLTERPARLTEAGDPARGRGCVVGGGLSVISVNVGDAGRRDRRNQCAPSVEERERRDIVRQAVARVEGRTTRVGVGVAGDAVPVTRAALAGGRDVVRTRERGCSSLSRRSRSSVRSGVRSDGRATGGRSRDRRVALVATVVPLVESSLRVSDGAKLVCRAEAVLGVRRDLALLRLITKELAIAVVFVRVEVGVVVGRNVCADRAGHKAEPANEATQQEKSQHPSTCCSHVVPPLPTELLHPVGQLAPIELARPLLSSGRA
jgi:hypothetical protein